eukprot:TRINITY_DN11165_c0_g1_i3.p1 TRINITY_DN11165_c0_g1~~TRINITY_DN11165_c0_g1_i3.p1  ORF type:complete len:280 (+),score=101.74 TRINITY_DN11165_c0_g1_i3:24-863(+)
MPLKLGSNWKACGVGADMRRFAHGNARINFGFCKGDDNFGGRKRKELDDFLKSLGKSMNLVMYRMQDTERVRTKLREDRRQELRTKAEREEEREKAQMERLERNRKWREKKLGTENLEDIPEEKVLDEKEERRLKNKEWREKRLRPRPSRELTEYHKKANPSGSLETQLLPSLECPYCQAEMCPPTKIFQCSQAHNLCDKCKSLRQMKVCPQCQEQFAGRNIALEKVASVVFSRNYPDGNVVQSFTFITHIPDDTGDDGHDTELDSEDMEDVTKWLGNC